MKRIKVLLYVDRLCEGGGTQSFIINLLNSKITEQIYFDCLTQDDGVTYEIEDKLADKGINVYKLPHVWLSGLKNLYAYNRALEKFFKKHNYYDIVHVNGTSKEFLVLYYAKKYGIKNRIMHVHCTDFATSSKVKKIIGKCLKVFVKKYASTFFACSNNAGVWLFGKDVVQSDAFHYIPNAIDVNRYLYNSRIRTELRNKLDIRDDTIVIGNVSRFIKSKNHQFLIDFFCLYHQYNEKSILCLCGDGIEMEAVKAYAKDKGIFSKIYFCGNVNNVNEYLQIFDYFVFPSLYEGLGIAVIEAQAAGLPVLVFDKCVPRETGITDSITYMNTNSDAKDWLLTIKRIEGRYPSRDSRVIEHNFKDKGFSTEDGWKLLYNIYSKL